MRLFLSRSSPERQIFCPSSVSLFDLKARFFVPTRGSLTSSRAGAVKVELVGGERHALVSIAALDAVVLPLEGDALLVEGDQAAVGDGNAVGVTRQIGQHCLRSAEWRLAVDDPFDL